jgi:peptide-methionine (R)-S-oxide reductase
MRFPSFPTIIRTFHTFANSTIRAANPTLSVSRLYSPPQRATILRSMPIPFISSLFGSSAKMADNTNYPVQKTEGEWQAVLSPGMSLHFHHTFLLVKLYG